MRLGPDSSQNKSMDMFNSEINSTTQIIGLIDEEVNQAGNENKVFHPIKSSSFSELETIKKAIKKKGKLAQNAHISSQDMLN